VCPHHDLGLTTDYFGSFFLSCCTTDFYAMKYDLPQASSLSSPDREDGPRTTTKLTSRLIPIGKGIISRAALTGEAWVISDLKKEPDFLPAIREQYGGEIPDQLKHMLVVPVLDGQGRTIAVIRALNKKASSGKNGFTDTDVQILKNLASHITVSLQSFFRDEDKEEMRLRDTIRLLKQHGLDGMETPTPRNIGIRSRPSLFPANQGEKE
jgi:GAF domain-containing protein